MLQVAGGMSLQQLLSSVELICSSSPHRPRPRSEHTGAHHRALSSIIYEQLFAHGLIQGTQRRDW